MQTVPSPATAGVGASVAAPIAPAPAPPLGRVASQAWKSCPLMRPPGPVPVMPVNPAGSSPASCASFTARGVQSDPPAKGFTAVAATGATTGETGIGAATAALWDLAA